MAFRPGAGAVSMMAMAAGSWQRRWWIGGIVSEQAAGVGWWWLKNLLSIPLVQSMCERMGGGVQVSREPETRRDMLRSWWQRRRRVGVVSSGVNAVLVRSNVSECVVALRRKKPPSAVGWRHRQ